MQQHAQKILVCIFEELVWPVRSKRARPLPSCAFPQASRSSAGGAGGPALAAAAGAGEADPFEEAEAAEVEAEVEACDAAAGEEALQSWAARALAEAPARPGGRGWGSPGENSVMHG